MKYVMDGWESWKGHHDASGSFSEICALILHFDFKLDFKYETKRC